MNQRTLVLCDLLALVPSLHSNSFFKVSYFFIQNRQHKRIHCKKLMFDFVDYFIGKSVVLHATTKDMKMDLLSVAKEVNKLGKYAAVASYNQGTLY